MSHVSFCIRHSCCCHVQFSSRSNSIVEQYQKLHPASSSVASPSDNGSAPSPKADLDGVPTIPLGDLFAGRPGLKRLLDDFAAETRYVICVRVRDIT